MRKESFFYECVDDALRLNMNPDKKSINGDRMPEKEIIPLTPFHYVLELI
jgi:hypothetical protein